MEPEREDSGQTGTDDAPQDDIASVSNMADLSVI